MKSEADGGARPGCAEGGRAACGRHARAALWRTRAGEGLGPGAPAHRQPPPGRKRTMCAPRAGPPTEADKDLRADAEQEKTE